MSSSRDAATGPDGRAKILYGPINPANVGTLKVLNEAVFPVRYSEKFYKQVPSTPGDLTKYSYYRDIVVGAICCRLEDAPAAPEGSDDKCPPGLRAYIMTLGVLAPYRGMKIGTQLLEMALSGLAARNAAVDRELADADGDGEGGEGGAAAAGGGDGGDGDAGAKPSAAKKQKAGAHEKKKEKKNDPRAKRIHEVFLHVQSNNEDAMTFYAKFGFEKGETVEDYYKNVEPRSAVILRKRLG